MKWFMHDSNASMNAKLKKLILKYGAEGYGVYWFCIEAIAQQVEAHNLTFELEHDAELIAHSLGSSDKKVADIMRFMVDLNLFEASGGVITCLKLAKRVDEYTKKLLKNRDTIPTLSVQSPTKSVLLDKNRIDNIDNKFKSPTLEEVKDHFEKNSIPLDAVAFFNHYESVNWFRGKTKIKKWKACINVWLANKDKFGGNNVQPQNKESHIQRHALNIEQTKQALREHDEFVARLASSKKATETGASNK